MKSPSAVKWGADTFNLFGFAFVPPFSALSLLSIIALILDLPSVPAFVSHGQTSVVCFIQ